MFIENKIKELEQIRVDLPKQAKLIAEKFKGEILDYIREKQLFDEGINGFGEVIGVYKETVYEPLEHKNTKGYPKIRGTVYNFLDSGDFTSKMDLIYTDQNALGIFSRDEKTPDLIERYGASIFIFTPENIEEINSKIFEENLIKWILNTRTFTQI